MSDDSGNPFHNLAKELAARGRKSANERPAGPSGALRPPKTRGRSGDEADDAALFFEAVRHIAPLQGKKRAAPGNETSMAEALAATLRAQSGASPVAGKTGADVPARPKREEARGSAGPGRAGGGPRLRAEALREPELSRAAHAAPDQAPGEEEEALFAKAMRGVAGIGGKGRAVAPPGAAGKPVLAPDPAKALRDVLEGRVEFALHHTDEFMEGYVVGVDPLALARLRNGQYSPEKHLDLHGLNARQAYEALTWFIKEAYQRGMRTVVVITGRGKNSPDGVGVLRPLLQRWLSRDPFKRVVLAFCTARPCDGGAGAVYVLLRKYKKSRGKIIWEQVPSDDDFPDI